MSGNISYTIGINAHNKETKGIIEAKDREIRELKRVINCKHMRESSVRKEGGYLCACLTCGEVQFKEDKPLNELEKANKLMFESFERHNEWREKQGLKPAGCE